MNRRRTMTAVLGVAAVASAVLPMSVAGAAGGAIVNGDFESDAVGSAVVTGWSFTDDLVDLGVTRLGGCVSQDTSDYTTLRDYADEARGELVVPVGADGEVLLPGTTTPLWIGLDGLVADADADGAMQVYYGEQEFEAGDGPWTETTFYVVIDGSPVRVYDVYGATGGEVDPAPGFYDTVYPLYAVVPDPSVRADNVPAVTDQQFWGGEPSFTSEIIGPDGVDEGDPEMRLMDDEGSDLTPASQALLLSSDMSSDVGYGYVAHGPAAVSEAFTTTSARTVTLDWAASGASDDYHVLGYVLNVDTCQQVEVLDSTGQDSPWQTTSVALPAAGTYRFVFVAGTYDQSWGGAAGARLYVDNIRAVPVITGTGLDVQPMFGTGDKVASAPIQLTGGGLKPNSAWTAELHSTPVVLATGTTDADGNFWLLSSLPASVEAGKHQIILNGIAPNGSAMSSMVWITVTASGTLGYVSTVAEEGAGVTPAAGSTTGAQPVAVAAPPVTAAPAPAGRALANTGFESVTWLGLGSGLVAAGAVVLVASRRRAGQR